MFSRFRQRVVSKFRKRNATSNISNTIDTTSNSIFWKKVSLPTIHANKRDIFLTSDPKNKNTSIWMQGSACADNCGILLVLNATSLQGKQIEIELSGSNQRKSTTSILIGFDSNNTVTTPKSMIKSRNVFVINKTFSWVEVHTIFPLQLRQIANHHFVLIQREMLWIDGIKFKRPYGTGDNETTTKKFASTTDLMRIINSDITRINSIEFSVLKNTNIGLSIYINLSCKGCFFLYVSITVQLSLLYHCIDSATIETLVLNNYMDRMKESSTILPISLIEPTPHPTLTPTLTYVPTANHAYLYMYNASLNVSSTNSSHGSVLNTSGIAIDDQVSPIGSPSNQDTMIAVFASVLAVIIVVAFILQAVYFAKKSMDKKHENIKQENGDINNKNQQNNWNADHEKWCQQNQFPTKRNSIDVRKLSNVFANDRPNWRASVTSANSASVDKNDIHRFRGDTIISQEYRPYSSLTHKNNKTLQVNTNETIALPSRLSIHRHDSLSANKMHVNNGSIMHGVVMENKRYSQSYTGNYSDNDSDKLFSSTFVDDLQSVNIANDVLLDDVIHDIQTSQGIVDGECDAKE